MRILALFIFLFQSVAFANTNEPYWGAIKAPDRDARSKLANLGFSIEAVRNDVSYGFANLEILEKLREQEIGRAHV